MTQPTHAEIGDDAMGRHTQAAFLREIEENNSLKAQLADAQENLRKAVETMEAERDTLRAERDASRQQVRACLQLRRQEQAAYQAGDQA